MTDLSDPWTLNILARYAAKRAVTDRLAQEGIRANRCRALNALTDRYLCEHRAELIAKAEEDILTSARLWKVAEREEKYRAEALANSMPTVGTDHAWTE